MHNPRVTYTCDACGQEATLSVSFNTDLDSIERAYLLNPAELDWQRVTYTNKLVSITVLRCPDCAYWPQHMENTTSAAD